MSAINDKNVGMPTSEDFHIWTTHYYKGSGNPREHYEHWVGSGIKSPVFYFREKVRNQIVKDEVSE